MSELLPLTSHPTADELYRRLKPRLQHLSQATVYRNLEQLADAGVIGRIECGGDLRRFDGNPEPHPHFRCLSCGCVADLHDELALQSFGEMMQLLPKLRCRTLQVEFDGICSLCRKQTGGLES